MLRKSGNWYTNMQTHTHHFCTIFDTYELSNFRIFHSNAHSYCISLHSSHRICHYSLVCMMHSVASISSRVVFVALIVCYSLFSSGDRTRGCHVEVEADRRQRDSLRHRCRRIAVADSPTHPLAISSRRTDGRTDGGWPCRPITLHCTLLIPLSMFLLNRKIISAFYCTENLSFTKSRLFAYIISYVVRYAKISLFC